MDILFLLLYYKMIKMRNKFKKAKAIFLIFCFTECIYAAYLLNQHRQLTNGKKSW